MNSLVEFFPELVEEWDHEKNVVSPSEVAFGNNKKVWWKCKKGHSWNASPNSRTSNKTGCPYCSGRRTTKEKSLIVTHPELLEEWDYEKNTLKPEELSHGSQKKIWWKCKKGHSWQRIVSARIFRNLGCPQCRKKRS